MRWAARALTVVLLAGCGQYPSARLVATSAERPGPPAATDPPTISSHADGSAADPTRRPRRRPAASQRKTGASDDRQVAPPASADPRLPPPASRLAVVIGIDDYPGTDDLRAAEADARLVARTLLRLGFPATTTRVLLGREATADRILEATRWLAARTGPGSLGVLFYAGHVRRISGDPDGDGEDLDEVLVGSDGATVTDGALAAALAPARGRMWLAYAACYAAGFGDAAAPGRISTYASSEDSLAYESTTLGHSFMVEYMIRRAVPRDGPVSVEELYRRAWERMDGRQERFRPLQDDRVPGEVVLGAAPAPVASPPPQDDDGRPCLLVLRCED